MQEYAVNMQTMVEFDSIPCITLTLSQMLLYIVMTTQNTFRSQYHICYVTLPELVPDIQFNN